jgi:predicted DNA-binding WGR domain protein
LDRIFAVGDSVAMIAQPYRCYVERIDPKRNMARYYAMTIQMTLFGQVCLTRRWGRIGARGRSVQHSFDREDDAVRLFLHLLLQKRKRGYGPKARSAKGLVAEAKVIDSEAGQLPLPSTPCPVGPSGPPSGSR